MRVEEKKSAAYQVLGRELTSREKDLYGDLRAKELAGELLPKEQKLVLVRALIVIGEPMIAEKVLQVWPITKLQTFTELVEKLEALREKYGSVEEGINQTLIANIKDDEQAYIKAAKKAYETVFCIIPQDGDLAQIVRYLQENKIQTYSQMVTKLMESLTQEDKKGLLFKALDKIGRADLKQNKKFIDKILAQQFNCENLTKLLQPLASTKKAR